MTPTTDTAPWNTLADVVIVGSGGGALCAALAARRHGLQVLVLEKTEMVGGSTAMSGGVLWLPNNAVARRSGVADSREDARRYFAATVGNESVATSPARREAFLDGIDPMIELMEASGVPLRVCDGYSDYYDDRPGGKPTGRSIEADLFDINELGPWRTKLRSSPHLPNLPMYCAEGAPASVATRTAKGAWTVAKVVGRIAAGKLSRRDIRGCGNALQGRMLRAILDAEADVWTSTAVTDLVRTDGRVVGVVAERDGRAIRIGARCAVLLDSGGFAHNASMRGEYGRSPASIDWTVANPGDTGEVIAAAMRLGADVAHMDEAWWIPTSIQPDGKRVFAVPERGKPHAILVDGTGQRFVNEAASYMEVGRTMYERSAQFPAIPSWWIMDARYRRRYLWGLTPGGYTPRSWIGSGYFKRADTIEGLAEQCGIDPAALRATVDRFNKDARHGRDPEFHKGERAYDRYFGDPTVSPNPCVGTVEQGPFYAVALYPGDVGTCGGLLTDEHARVVDRGGAPVDGLYATGNCTASVMGRMYPGAGASIGASFVFGWIAAQHIASTAPLARISATITNS